MISKKERYKMAIDNGSTVEEVAAIYGVKPDTVKRALRSTNTPIKEEPQMPTQDPHVFPDEEEITQPQPQAVLQPIDIKCRNCGTIFTMSPAEQKFYQSKGFALPKRCKPCREQRGSMLELTCVDCGKEFRLSPTEQEFFNKQGLHYPKRCSSCRKFKRERNKELEENGLPT